MAKKKSGIKGIVGIGILGAAIYGLWSCGGLGFLGLGNGAGEGGSGNGISEWLDGAKKKIEETGENLAEKADEKLQELTGTSTPIPTKAAVTPAPTDTPVPTSTPVPTNTPIPEKKVYSLIVNGTDIIFDGILMPDVSSLDDKIMELYSKGTPFSVSVDYSTAIKSAKMEIEELLEALVISIGLECSEK